MLESCSLSVLHCTSQTPLDAQLARHVLYWPIHVFCSSTIFNKQGSDIFGTPAAPIHVQTKMNTNMTVMNTNMNTNMLRCHITRLVRRLPKKTSKIRRMIWHGL